MNLAVREAGGSHQSGPAKIFICGSLSAKSELGDYRSIRKEYNLPSVEEDEVDQVLKNLRANYSTAEPVIEQSRKVTWFLSKSAANLLILPKVKKRSRLKKTQCK